MPYIRNQRRYKIQKKDDNPYNAGELNYLLTITIMEYLNERGVSYKAINDIVGALEGAKMEFYRRVAVPYENSKMAEHGDVYDMETPPEGEA